MKTTKYVIAWGLFLIMFITIIALTLSGGKDIYRWFHPVVLDEGNQHYIKNNSYVVGEVSQLAGYRYREEQHFQQIYIDNSNGSRDCAVRIEGINENVAVIRVARDDRKSFLANFEEQNLIGKYNFKAQYVKLNKGMQNLLEHYNYVKNKATINTGNCEMNTDYYLRITTDNKPLFIWKIYVAATFVIIIIPYFIALKKKSIRNYAEYECDIDEYCRRKIAEREFITKAYRYDYEIEAELEKEKSNIKIYEKRYKKYKRVLKTGIIIWLVLAAMYGVFVLPNYYSITWFDMLQIDRIVFIGFAVGLYNVIKGSGWLVMNQDNKLAMWLASQTGYTPVKVKMFISNVLISRYESRLTAIHEAGDTNI